MTSPTIERGELIMAQSRKQTKAELSPAMKQLVEQYSLTKDDFWQLPQNKSYILLHDACMRIATEAGVVFDKPVWLQQGPDNWALELSGSIGEKTYWTTGEASKANTKQSYPLAMAEKRAKDRLTLYLTGHYHQGIKSEIEAEAYAKPKDDEKETVEEESLTAHAPSEIIASPKKPVRTGSTKKDLKLKIRSKRLELGISDEGMDELVRDLFGNAADHRTITTVQLKQLYEEVKNKEQQHALEELIHEETNDDKPVEEEQS